MPNLTDFFLEFGELVNVSYIFGCIFEKATWIWFIHHDLLSITNETCKKRKFLGRKKLTSEPQVSFWREITAFFSDGGLIVSRLIFVRFLDVMAHFNRKNEIYMIVVIPTRFFAWLVHIVLL